MTIGTDRRPCRWPANPAAELATPPPTEPTFAEPIEAVSDRVDRSLGKVCFVRDFGSAHNLIRHLLDEDELRRLKPSDPQRDAAKAEASFARALAIARMQQAKSWELRAATSLARLWRDRAKRQEARDLLAPVYGWFTEGFDTGDLREAKALLDDLAE